MKLLAIKLCWLIPFLTGLICAILGYLLGRLLRKKPDEELELEDNSQEIEEHKSRIKRLERDLEICKKSKLDMLSTSSKSTPPSTTSSFAASTPTPTTSTPKSNFDADAAKAVFGKRIKENDLTVVEGIGPKIQQLFHNNNVKTWKALSECSVDKCQEVLNSGGDRFKMHVPRTWPEQAKLAYQGNWQKLKDWQDSLSGGK